MNVVIYGIKCSVKIKQQMQENTTLVKGQKSAIYHFNQCCLNMNDEA